MTAKPWWVGVVLASLLGSSGCYCCNHQSSKLAVEAGPDCSVPLADRQHVYVFMIDGLAANTSSGLGGLRDELGRHGFMKVGTGQTIHAKWMRKEMVRIKADDPAARFVLVGFDIGCTVATRLAAQANIDGVPVDAIVLLDPPARTELTDPNIAALVIRSSRGGDSNGVAEGAVIPNVGHDEIPSHPETVGSLVRLLGEVSMRVEHGSAYSPVVISNYEHAPPPRTNSIPSPNAAPEWNFLHDVPGSHGERLAPVNAPLFGRTPATGSTLLPAPVQ